MIFIVVIIMQVQPSLLTERDLRDVKPFKIQLLKWIGNKQRFAHEIVSHFPNQFNKYYEPFLGSGAILGTLSPQNAVASDIFRPLVEIWQTLKNNPKLLIEWYSQRWKKIEEGDKKEQYEQIKASYNNYPNGADLLFLSRSCYGGVIRFRQADGYMSTPCGVHKPISPESFAERVYEWQERTKNTTFLHKDYKFAMYMAKKGDLIYCDPPYTFTQSILYGAQSFNLADLFKSIADCKKRGVFVALSIDGTKKSGDFVCDISIPKGLFEREIFVNCGQSMLKRFQMGGTILGKEIVSDRLLLTY